MRAHLYILFRWISVGALFLYLGISSASGNFALLQLQKAVTIELPRNWVTLSNNQRITLDTWMEAKFKNAGAAILTSDLNFAANYYDEKGKAAAMFNIRYYPEETLTQADILTLTPAEISQADEVAHNGVHSLEQITGMRVLEWMGTKKQIINGIISFVTEYRRAGVREGAPFRVRLIRVFSANRTFTVTISYREDQALFLKPICDFVIQSIRM